MGRKIKWAGDRDFGAFAFRGDVIYDIDKLGDVPADFVEQCVAAGAAEVTDEPAKPKTKKTEKPA